MSILKYLNEIKSVLLNGNNWRSINGLVIGNESADLDSVVASLCFACLLNTLQQQKYQEKSYISRSRNKIIVPLIQIPKSDFRLRLESRYVLNQYLNPEGDNFSHHQQNNLLSQSNDSSSSIDNKFNIEDLLLFLDSPDIQNLINFKSFNFDFDLNNFRLYLVDHNHFPRWFPSNLQSNIYCIIDHHKDTKSLMVTPQAEQLVQQTQQAQYVKKQRADDYFSHVDCTECNSSSISHHSNWKGEKLRWIEERGIGSCCTQICYLWHRVLSCGLLSQQHYIFDDGIKLMLLATIVKDTFGFRDEYRNSRWGDLDLQMAYWLMDELKKNNLYNFISIDQLKNKLDEIRSDLSLYQTFSLEEILSMDLKMFEYKLKEQEQKGNQLLEQQEQKLEREQQVKHQQKYQQEHEEKPSLIINIVYCSLSVPLTSLHTMFSIEEFVDALRSTVKKYKSDFAILMSCSVNKEKKIERFMSLYAPKENQYKSKSI